MPGIFLSYTPHIPLWQGVSLDDFLGSKFQLASCVYIFQTIPRVVPVLGLQLYMVLSLPNLSYFICVDICVFVYMNGMCVQEPEKFRRRHWVS